MPPRPVTYDDLGGVEEVLTDIRELIEYPLKHPEVSGVPFLFLLSFGVMQGLVSHVLFSLHCRVGRHIKTPLVP